MCTMLVLYFAHSRMSVLVVQESPCRVARHTRIFSLVSGREGLLLAC